MEIIKRAYYTLVVLSFLGAIFDTLAWFAYKEPWMSRQAIFLWAISLSPVVIVTVYAVLLYIIYGPVTD